MQRQCPHVSGLALVDSHGLPGSLPHQPIPPERKNIIYYKHLPPTIYMYLILIIRLIYIVRAPIIVIQKHFELRTRFATSANCSKRHMSHHTMRRQ